MKFLLEIELSNEDDGRLSNTDIETALQDVAREFHVPGPPNPAEGKARLLNGHEVGKWQIRNDTATTEPTPASAEILCIHRGEPVHIAAMMLGFLALSVVLYLIAVLILFHSI